MMSPPHAQSTDFCALEGRIVAVTNADQGFGRSIALLLAEMDATVILLSENPEAISVLASEIEEQGGEAIPIKASPTSMSDWRAALEKVTEIFGEVHGIVHVADRVSYSHFDYLPESEWVEIANYNVRSSLTILQHIKRNRQHTWVTIIAPPLDAQLLHMHAFRGALIHLTQHASQENLRVNLLVPSRAAHSDEWDVGLSTAVCHFADPRMEHIVGNIINVPLPPVPKPEALEALEAAEAEAEWEEENA
ncbi:SDR family NAD(P)-dependent oxidoreductase [Deinococcus roseus]|nr:SDR family NAD(P)-dependent oxidoreductase [Deinococcus roseus]